MGVVTDIGCPTTLSIYISKNTNIVLDLVKHGPENCLYFTHMDPATSYKLVCPK